MSGHINGGIRGVIRAEARDDEAANNLRDVIRGFMALGKLQAGSNPQVQLMLESLELGAARTRPSPCRSSCLPRRSTRSRRGSPKVEKDQLRKGPARQSALSVAGAVVQARAPRILAA